MFKPCFRARLVASLVSLATTQAFAAPSPYSTMIVFGDSLADTGQFPDVGGPAGSTLRFTNRSGPNYLNDQTEPYLAVSSTLLGQNLGIASTDLNASTSPVRAAQGLPDGNNWAVGGYRTDNIFDSITSRSDTVIPPGTPGAGIVLRSRQGYLPANGGRADPNALYLISGGGNDFFQRQVTSAAQAAAAAGRLADGALALQQAGARYIMVWMLPDIGQTPAFNGGANQPIASALSSAFNQVLRQRLAQIDAQIIPLNVPLLLEETFSDPTRFGFAADQNLKQSCFSDITCANPTYGVGGTQPDPNKLVYNDSVHPTEAAQRLIADYAYSILAAPWEVTLLPEMAHSALRGHQDELRNEWRVDGGNWQAVGQWRSIVAGGGQRLDVDEQSSSVSAQSKGASVNVGGSYRLNDAWRVGMAAGFYRQTLEAGANNSEYKLNSYLASAFAQFHHNSWWADTAMTAGRAEFDSLERKFALGISEGTEKSNTHGRLLALSSRLGYDIAQPGSEWHLSPFVSADFARVDINGYSEKAMRSTSLTFGDQRRDSKRLGVGLQGSYSITPQTQVFGEVAHEHEFEQSAQQLKTALNSVPELDFKLRGYSPPHDSNRLNLGASHHLTKDVVLNAAYTIRKDEHSTQQGINAGLSVFF